LNYQVLVFIKPSGNATTFDFLFKNHRITSVDTTDNPN
jgi:hypothetical protein